jgi:phenylalanyl-tRNA synthetase alpha chain
MVNWTSIQKQRLLELGAEPEKLKLTFDGIDERNKCYQDMEHELVNEAKEKLDDFRKNIKRPELCSLERQLDELLVDKGFCRVTTPVLLSRGLLAKMTVTEEHPLFKQVFWVDSRKCLRPMLAPNLYYILRDLLRIWTHPVSIFEIGPCFRKDTQGGRHMQEFTMLNLVEMGLPEEHCYERLVEMAGWVMKCSGIDKYRLESEESQVYGKTVDIVSEETELGSGAIGPHILDRQWDIHVPWVGIGFGLERLAMIKEGHGNIQRTGRSLSYLNGVRLNIS